MGAEITEITLSKSSLNGIVTLSNGSRTNMQEIYVNASAVTAFHMLDASLRNCRSVLREIKWRQVTASV